MPTIESDCSDPLMKEWESHDPGYFSAALFDHREFLSRLHCLNSRHWFRPVDMPICDGVDACKRIRVLENKRRVRTVLPSKLTI